MRLVNLTCFVVKKVCPDFSVSRDLEGGAVEYDEPTKEQVIQELKEAVIELKLVEQGKL
jgi:hypothetical protein